MLPGDEAYSIARRFEGDIYFTRGGRALGGAALSLRRGWSIRESGSKNIFHHLRISDHDAVAAGKCKTFDDSLAAILHTQSLPDSSSGGGIHAARVCDFPA